ncbi:unnamed protein product [Rotaria magnacalcarata]|uniref:Uncharacterized protein n=1 Tax=Rotaria magnacalcarata TaxID=392030 RepID=A0A820D5G1_9BILA|nr:unnamed protein product [Rotaria magnacalcarata]CAF4227342.1 unnamed protein product [Rotaria magnacalcarata]
MINCALNEAKSLLPCESSIAILPLLPISLIDLYQDHTTLHTCKAQFPDYFVASSSSELHQLYPKWMSMILNLALSSMAKTSLKYPYKPGELPKLRKLETMKCSDKDEPTYEIWKELLSNVVEAALFKSVSGEASICDQITRPQPVKLKGNSIILFV